MYVAYAIAFLICIFLLHYLAPIAKSIGLVDRPNVRKGAVEPVPLIGGVGMFISVAFAILLIPQSLQQYRYLIFSAGILVVVGVLDDHRDLPPHGKFVAQFFASAILVYLGGTTIEFVGDIFNQFTDRGMVRAQGLGRFAEPLTVVAIVALINFMNFIDGHDGLAGSITVSSLVGLTILILLRGQETHLFIILLLGSVLCAFLLFNWPLQITKKKRVYMGDAGSMFVGLFLAFLLIELSQPGQGMRGWDNRVLSPPVALWLVGLPLLDGLSVIGMRLLRGKSPIRADRGHIHHYLKRLGMSDATISLILLGTNVTLVVAGVIFSVFEAEDSIVFWSFLFLTVVYLVLKYRFCLKDGLPV